MHARSVEVLQPSATRPRGQPLIDLNTPSPKFEFKRRGNSRPGSIHAPPPPRPAPPTRMAPSQKYPFGTARSLSWRRPSIRSCRGGTDEGESVCGRGGVCQEDWG